MLHVLLFVLSVLFREIGKEEEDEEDDYTDDVDDDDGASLSAAANTKLSMSDQKILGISPRTRSYLTTLFYTVICVILD